jgi:NAD(P)-dependent dehydrogenase (short-subunit alcohol dehydrogenase family)
MTVAIRFGSTSTTGDVLHGRNLAGKRVLVTGVSSGVGVETARVLAAHGASVVGTSRNLAKGAAAIDAVGAASNPQLVELDLASFESVHAGADVLLASA